MSCGEAPTEDIEEYMRMVRSRGVRMGTYTTELDQLRSIATYLYCTHRYTDRLAATIIGLFYAKSKPC